MAPCRVASGWSQGKHTLSFSHPSEQFLTQTNVAIAPATPSDYTQESRLTERLRSLCQELGWGDGIRGSFSNIVPPRARVLVKPNFVLHENRGPWTFDAVITHPSLVKAAVAELLLTEADEVLVGDAPVQGCDFEQLLKRSGLGAWAAGLSVRQPRFAGISDFRRTVSITQNGVRFAAEDKVDLSRYVLFDLGRDSLLEPVTTSEPRFRVTCYDPKLLATTHFPGRHQYLIAKAVLEADIVVNLPKLKMHCKAGVTNALKNVVGINGNKEYLPHHRIGGSDDSGDCYPGTNRIKRIAESLYDYKNASTSVLRSRVIHQALKPLNAMLKIGGDETGVEGSWSGNDTVWRMALDLNRVLIYGRPDGTMSELPQRTILHLSDAVIAGQGRGPMSPRPFELGILMAGNNPAAMDWVGASLLSLDPAKVPLLSGVFGDYRWPLVRSSSGSIRVIANNRTTSVEKMLSELQIPRPTHIPPGWESVVRSTVPDVSDSGANPEGQHHKTV